jgi:protein-S-isoprenylcysteine O-methyltransferase Ste14
MIPVVFVSLFVWRSWDDESLTDFFVEWIGYILLVLGLAVRLWATLYIGRRKSRLLVTDGPYSLCRNPLYIGTILAAMGAALCFENFLLLILVFVLLVPVHALVVLAEERHLAELFGSEYEEYRHRTSRFWPSLRNYRRPETIEVSTRTIRRAVLDVMLVMLIPPAGDMVELLHARGLLPVLWKPF